MIQVTYEYPTANGSKTTHSYICQTDEQAEHVCQMVEARKDQGYKLIDVTRI